MAAVRKNGNSGKLPLPVVSDVAIYNLIIKMQMDNMNFGQPLAQVVCPLLGVWHMFYRYKSYNIVKTLTKYIVVWRVFLRHTASSLSLFAKSFH